MKRVALLVPVLVVGAAACGNSPHHYSDELVANFMHQCTFGGSTAQQCHCAIAKIQQQKTGDVFGTDETRYAPTPAHLPPYAVADIKACGGRVNLGNTGGARVPVTSPYPTPSGSVSIPANVPTPTAVASTITPAPSTPGTNGQPGNG